MKLVFEVNNGESNLLCFTEDPTLAETLIVERFQEVGLEKDDLVALEVDGVKTYTIRTPILSMDEEGNAFFEVAELTAEEMVDQYLDADFIGEFIWVVHDAEDSVRLNLLNISTQFLDLTPCHAFETEENLEPISTIRA